MRQLGAFSDRIDRIDAKVDSMEKVCKIAALSV